MSSQKCGPFCYNPQATWKLSTVATDALVLKHQTISIHSAEQLCIAFDQYHRKNITSIVKNNILVKCDPVC